jgi:hypothetical protein
MKRSTSFPESPRRERLPALGIARAIGAVVLLVAGSVHLEQYTVANFSVIPTIGSLFLLNFIAATAIGLVLLIPIRVTVGPRRLVIALAAEAVAIISLGAILALARRRSRRLNANTSGREDAIRAIPATATEA